MRPMHRDRDVYIDPRRFARETSPDATALRKAGREMTPDLSGKVTKATPPMAVPLNLQFPSLNASARRYDPFRPARIHQTGYRSMTEARRQPDTLLASYLPRDHATGTLLLPQTLSKVLQALQRVVDRLELLPVEQALLHMVLPAHIDEPDDIQGKEMIASVSDQEKAQLIAYLEARLPQFGDFAGLTKTESYVERRSA